MPVQRPLTLTPARALQTVVGNLFPISTNDMTRAEDDSQEAEVPIPLPAWMPVNECSSVFLSTRLLLRTYTIVG